MKLFAGDDCGGFYFTAATDKENQPSCLMLLSVPTPVFELHSDYIRLGPSVDTLIWV